ncbi:MAG: ABC transporter ATP-binding protein [Clostridia bacterium]|nr:ABC transporter ATP-binding protein [Clostridia bacterium]
MKKLLIYLKGSRTQCVLAPLFKMLEAILELFVPLVMASIIDKGIGAGDKSYIIKMCLILVALGAVGLGFSVTAQFFAAQASTAFVKRLKHALFEHIGKLSYSQLDAMGASTLITRMTGDMDSVQNGLNLTLRLLLRSPFVVAGAMVMAFTVDAKAAITFVVVIPALSAVVFGILFSCIPLYKKVRSHLDSVLGSARENLVGARVLRAFRKEEEQISDFEAKNEALTKMQEFTGRISALLNPITFIIVNVGIAVLIYAGAIRVEAGVITQGAVVALYNYMSQILVELVKFANLIISITKSVACAGRISAVLETQADIREGNGDEYADGEIAVEFNNVSFTYSGAGDASLEKITFSARKGETVGVIGSTGSGKTTLINLIPAFYRPSEGSVTVLGKNISDWNETQLRERIAVVPQKSVLFKGTVRDNMLWGKSNASDEEIWSALEIAQAKDFVMQKEGGLDAPVEQGGTNFSGGQRQRLCVARAVISDADILILDDSSSALDYATDSAMRKAIAASQGEKTVFIVSQRTSSIMGADKIIVLDDGVAQIGTHEELMKTGGVYREIHLSQFDEEEEAV